MRKLSIITLLPIVLVLFFSSLIAKKVLIDLPTIVENEKKVLEKELLLKASALQSHFSYFFRKGDSSQIKQELSLISLDYTHYDFVLILNKELKPIFSTDKMLSFDSEKIKNSLEQADFTAVQKNDKIHISYEKEDETDEYFNVIIPINYTLPKETIRSQKQILVFFRYKIQRELQLIKDTVNQNVLNDLAFIFILLLVGVYVHYKYSVRPLFSLLKATKKVQEKDYDISLSDVSFKEINQLTHAFSKMSRTIQRDFNVIEQQQQELKAKSLALATFERVVDQSPSHVVITNLDGVINYINPSFCSSTGFEKSELLGKNINIIQSNEHNEDFFKKICKEVDTSNVWKGQVVNKKKDGKNITLRSSVFPIFDAEDKQTNYVCIQVDITKELEQRKALAFQSKQAQMGEMVSMIAHQWRQPLATVNSIVAALELSISLDELNNETLVKKLSSITSTNVYLSQTIDDFRSFLKTDKEKKETSFSEIVRLSLNLIEHSIHILRVTIKTDIDDISFVSYENELSQVVLNLLKNSTDIFSTKPKMKNKIINFFTEVSEDHITLVFQDNAGGSDVEPIENIFSPYFTTKEDSDGTGLGLYMSKTIIEEHCLGTLTAKNIPDGIEFRISIPRNKTL